MQFRAQYLENNNPKAIAAAKNAMEYFKPFGPQREQSYVKTSFSAPEACKKGILNMLKETLKNSPNYNHNIKNS